MNMLERMAVASLKVRGMHPSTDIVDVWKLYNKKTIIEEMKAILEAMREPTEKMCKAMYDGPLMAEDHMDNSQKDWIKDCWQSMIDAALKE